MEERLLDKRVKREFRKRAEELFSEGEKWRAISHMKVAKAVEEMNERSETLEDWMNCWEKLPGIGKSLSKKIAWLAKTKNGNLAKYEALRQA